MQTALGKETALCTNFTQVLGPFSNLGLGFGSGGCLMFESPPRAKYTLL